MLLFRSLSVGLLGACVVLLASRPAYEVRIARDAPTPAVLAPPSASIVDVAAGVPAAELPALIALAPGEHVTAIGDRPVTNDLEAGAELVAAGVRAGSYVDLTVGTAA
jgi:S1-C subfamily serine protease